MIHLPSVPAKGEAARARTRFLENHLLAVFFPAYSCLLTCISHVGQGGSLGSPHPEPFPGLLLEPALQSRF